MTAIWIVSLIIAAAMIWLVTTYNGLVRLRNMKDEGWSGIDVQLRRRSDLVPNLVETVKGYAAHEKDTLQNITNARAAAVSAKDEAKRLSAENDLSGALRTLFAVAENYPDLKANANFLDLQKQLSAIEDDIQMARRYYNGTVRNLNMAIQRFPAVLVARRLGFTEAPFFETDDEKRHNPQIKF